MKDKSFGKNYINQLASVPTKQWNFFRRIIKFSVPKTFDHHISPTKSFRLILNFMWELLARHVSSHANA